MIPVPGAQVGTPFGVRGRHWSCAPDLSGNGIHTGIDYPAPIGTPVIAARPGRLVHCDHGSAFGNHQVEVRCGDGTRDFYAHMTTRSPEGTVAAGDPVGTVGAEGNVTGPHLHFERHATETGIWSCSVIRDPQPSIDYAQEEDVDYDKIREIVAEEVAKNNTPLVDKVWSRGQKVTLPDGKTDTRALSQLVREIWQRVGK